MAEPGVGLREERVCPDCRGTSFVEDHAAGDIVCTGCGLVVEAHIIDERSEWRTFGDKDKEGDDPSRVGGASNPLLDGGGLTTGIGRIAQGAAGGMGQYHALSRLQNRQNVSDRAMQAAMREIGATCERLKVNDVVRNSALEIFKDTHDAKTLKGRTLKAVYAACIFVAAKREKNNRTFKEICAVMPEVNKVDIGRCFTAIDRMYKAKAQHRALAAGKDLAGAVAGGVQPGAATGLATQATDLIKRFMSRLGTETKLSLLAYRVGQQAAELAAQEAVPWAARDPATQACGLIYGVMQIYKLRFPDSPDPVPTWEQLSTIGGMAPATIRDGYRSMLPWFVIPGKLVSEADGPPEVLAQLEACFRSTPAPGGTSGQAGKKTPPAAAKPK